MSYMFSVFSVIGLYFSSGKTILVSHKLKVLLVLPLVYGYLRKKDRKTLGDLSSVWLTTGVVKVICFLGLIV